jgi:hypothetical protein
MANVDDHRQSVRDCHIGLASQLKMVVVRSNVVKASRAGRVGYGDSFILSPLGEPLVEARLFKTELITAGITPGTFRSPSVWADLNETPAWLRTQLAGLLNDFRKPASDSELRSWLENMIVFHRFTPGEVSAATGLSLPEVDRAIRRFELNGKAPPPRAPGNPLRVLPYPGGRHPRLGFLEGAVVPQRETKLSVFTPWDDSSYVAVDVPEAIFSNLGLTYLAHTHIPTIWDAQGITLPRLEWSRLPDGGYESQRVLPNGIAFGSRIKPNGTGGRIELWLRNGTKEKLTGLRVQNCVMLGRARGFEQQTNANKVFRPPFAAVRSDGGNRWIISAWTPNQRCWGNEACPCLHSDPQFADCPPGQTVRVHGWLSFYEGSEIEKEFDRIEQADGRDGK